MRSAGAADGSPVARRPSPRDLGRAVLAVAATAGCLVLLLPRVSGVPWQDIAVALRSPTPAQLALLLLLWAAGLVVHSRVVTSAMPGLSTRRALTLNLTGSAVANVVPLGGGAGIGLNYVMVRRWGFTAAQFSLFTGIVNVWNVAAKALLPAVAVGLLLLSRSALLPVRLLAGAAAVSALLVVLVALAAAALLTRRGSRAAGRVLDRVVARGPRRLRAAATSATAGLDAARAAALGVLRSAWRPMTVGVLAYNVLQAVLLWASLHAAGAPIGLVAMVAVFAVERAATALPVTPGGSGVAEVTATAAVVALGGAPAAAAAGVLLYRALVFGLEIPVGGTWLLGWWLAQRGQRSEAAAASGAMAA